jgi:murein DD-endopeptidase MepM/ murein hydrolase activator NlpD
LIKDRLYITVSDVHKTKSYSLNKIIKKVILYVTIIALLIFGIGFWFISYLKDEVDNLSLQEKKLEKQNKLYNAELEDKKKYIEELDDTLKKIEENIGITNNDEVSLMNRATIIALTSSQKIHTLDVFPSGSPLKEMHVTASFGYRTHPILHTKKFHKGIDLRAARRTEVYSTADGVVSFVHDSNSGAYGRIVRISHNYGFQTAYAHLRAVKVKVGDVVAKGQIIALSGNSGRSNGPHLHYEISYANKILNPIYFIRWSMKNYDKIFEKQRRVPWESLISMINRQKQVQKQEQQ